MAATTDEQKRVELPALGLDAGVFAVKAVLVEGDRIRKISYPTAGKPRQAAFRCLKHLLDGSGEKKVRCGLVGHNAGLLSAELGIEPLLEIEALQAGLVYTNAGAGALLSLGHENMYYLEFDEEGKITHFNRNAQCAAGSGSFWYQQATRMGYNDREMAEIALKAGSAVPISGRCAVFAKSDMTHAINDGATRGAVAAGMARALVETILTGVAQNRVRGPGTLILAGGVAENKAVLKYLQEYAVSAGLDLSVPPLHRYLGALGAAAKGLPVSAKSLHRGADKETGRYEPESPLPPLDPSKVVYVNGGCAVIGSGVNDGTVYLGVDCGSVSTKCALLDKKGRYIGGVYLPTSGRPALQVLALMKEVEQRYGKLLEKASIIACTTGSGRFLSQKILEAEFAADEITCQAEGIKQAFPDAADLAIFEIGGEDSKFLQLKERVLSDYNMNPVCAAGTGTFLENLAELLGIKMIGEFSKKAFAAAYAVDLGDTCTLLSQSTLASAAARGLPLEAQLASLAYASARNYLGKTVEQRPLEGKLVFTGATAKNRALAAALAAECGRGITVPPRPELTGALGAAVMARILHRQNPALKNSFRGLRRLNTYTVARRTCRSPCEYKHRCTLHTVAFSKGKKFIYGDRCGKYSSRELKKDIPALPDYARRREELFFKAAGEPCKTGPRVGIARGGLFYDFYPFWSAFFRALGARAVLTDPTGPGTLEKGKSALDTEMCLPMEINVGHYRELSEREPDYIFLPEVVDLKPLSWAPRWPRAFTCSLLQTIEGTMVSSLSLDRSRLLTAQLNFREGPARIKEQLRPAAKKLMGDAFTERRFRRAVKAGYAAMSTFERSMEEESRLILKELREDGGNLAALFLSRPYTIYDDFVSKGSLRHARERGLPALPHEFLFYYLRGWYEGRIAPPDLDPFKKEFKKYLAEVLQKMDHIYPAQLQKMLSSAIFALFLNRKAAMTGLPLFHLVLHDPFKCGPNTMFRHYLDNLAPYLRLTLDEHTAPAGLITRLEAFKNTYRSGSKHLPRTTTLSARTVSVASRRWDRLLIPEMSRHSHTFAAMFRRFGVDASLLPRSTDSDLALARRCANGEECLPFLQNLQDYLEYFHNNPAAGKENIVFFQGLAAGPCRYGFYAPTQALAINRAGYGGERVCAVGLIDALLRFGLGYALPLFSGMTAMDLLYKMLHRTRPYEKEKGASNRLFELYSKRLLGLLEQSRFNVLQLPSGSYRQPFEALLNEAAAAFAALPRTGEKRPLILLGGEFYVRWDSRCNEEIIGQIEKAGGEVSLAPATEVGNFTAYVNYREACERYRTHRNLLNYALQKGYGLLNSLAHRDHRNLERSAAKTLQGLEEPPPGEIRKEARLYITGHYGGEPPMTMGRAASLARRGAAAGAIFVAPFNCMPGSYVEAQQGLMQREMGIPVLTVYYDGKKNANRREQIAGLVYQAGQGSG